MFLLFLAQIGHSQIEGKNYVVDYEFHGSTYTNPSTSANNTNSSSVSYKTICVNDTISVIDTSHKSFVRIRIIAGNTKCDNYAIQGDDYLIFKTVFTENGNVHEVKNIGIGIGVGVLTVPFKFDPSTFKVYPSGEVGGIAGPKFCWVKSGLNIMIGMVLGLSTIPLNDLNAPSVNQINTVGGITWGGGFTLNLPKTGLQFGFFYGADFYNTNNTKFQKNWLSFGIGYDFIKVIGSSDNSKTILNKTLIKAPGE
jgi:hypothetical protein